MSSDERHETDAVSLMGGLLLLLVGAVYLVGDLTTLELDGRWIAPVGLIAVGAVGLLTTLRQRRSGAP